MAAFDDADAMVFGGGGLLQDESSAWNLTYHLSRVGMADRRHLPWVGVGLGAAGITTRRGERTVADALRQILSAVSTSILNSDPPIFEMMRENVEERLQEGVEEVENAVEEIGDRLRGILN